MSFCAEIMHSYFSPRPDESIVPELADNVGTQPGPSRYERKQSFASNATDEHGMKAIAIQVWMFNFLVYFVELSFGFKPYSTFYPLLLSA
mgnify:FL=1